MADQRFAIAKTALIVDDERVCALGLQRTLIDMGYDVPVTVGSGEEALKAAATFGPELVLMDLRLKGSMDGIETALRLRECREFALIYVTGAMDKLSQGRAESSFPDAWLPKPFTRAELETAIEEAVIARSARFL